MWGQFSLNFADTFGENLDGRKENFFHYLIFMNHHSLLDVMFLSLVCNWLCLCSFELFLLLGKCLNKMSSRILWKVEVGPGLDNQFIFQKSRRFHLFCGFLFVKFVWSVSQIHLFSSVLQIIFICFSNPDYETSFIFHEKLQNIS